MKIYSTYKVKIKHLNHIFEDTVILYRKAVDFYIAAVCTEWESLSLIPSGEERLSYMERNSIRTKNHPLVAYDFSSAFYKFPCYLRRAAINEALGMVSSYRSNLQNWEKKEPVSRGRKPSIPVAGNVFPAMYRKNTFIRTGTYTASLKVWIRNTWDWIDVELKKGDADYILRRCRDRKECVPTLQKRGKEWFLDFSFEEDVKLSDCDISETVAVAVDLGINNACVCSVMCSDGTVIGREFLSLPREKDCLTHSINRIRKAQQHGNRKTPRLWASTEGINDRIAVLTTQFITDVAVKYNADVIVFEHLDLDGKKRGSKKQRLHLWRARYVQAMVTDKAHRMSMHISHVCAWGTSKLAYDGSGAVERGIDGNYSICRFTTGKIYNCDLSASYNIGARYFIRKIMESLPETARLAAQAKVPELAKRSTCTLSSLISLSAVLSAYAA